MLVRIACFAALGGFLFGYDLGLIGGAMLEISRTFSITSSSTKEAIVGAAKLGAFFGTFIGGALMLRYGRRIAMASNSIFFTAGPLIMAASWGPGGLILGRLVAGLGIGASAIVAPAYLAEIAPAQQRGAVVQTYEVMLTVGMLLAVLIDWALSSTGSPSAWRWMVGLPALPGLLLGASLVLLPESPRWLVMRGQLEAALATIHAVLRKSNGDATAEDAKFLAQAEDELLLLWSSVEKEQAATHERLAGTTPQQQQQQQQQRQQQQQLGHDVAENGTSMQQQTTSIITSYKPPVPDTQRLPAHKEQQPGQDRALPPAHVFQLENDLDSTSTFTAPAADEATTPGASRRTTIDDAGGYEDGYSQQLLPKSHEHSSAATASPKQRHAQQQQQRQQQQQQQQQQQKRPPPGQEPTLLATLVTMLTDIKAVARGPERRAFALAAGLAVFDQATASTAIINYAPEVLATRLGVVSESAAVLYPVAIAFTKVAGVAVALLVVDSAGRRPLLIGGGGGCAAALALAVGAIAQRSVALYLLSMCAYILAFSLSWAGLYWVVVSEIFSMGAKSPAISAATSLLFLTGSAVNFVFLSLIDWLGAYAFLVFAVIAVASAVFVAVALPETKGRTLAEVQALLAVDDSWALSRGGLLGGGSAAGSSEADAAWQGSIAARSRLQGAWSSAAATRRRWFGGWGRIGQREEGQGEGAEEGVQMMGLALPLGMELGHQRRAPGHLERNSHASRDSEPL